MDLAVLGVLMQILAGGVVRLTDLVAAMDEAADLLSLSQVCRCQFRSRLQSRGHRLAAMANRAGCVGMKAIIQRSRREFERLHDFDGQMPFHANLRAVVRELAVGRYVISQLSRVPRLQQAIQRITEVAEGVYPELGDTDAESELE
jgi:hypothetical protein